MLEGRGFTGIYGATHCTTLTAHRQANEAGCYGLMTAAFHNEDRNVSFSKHVDDGIIVGASADGVQLSLSELSEYFLMKR